MSQHTVSELAHLILQQRDDEIKLLGGSVWSNHFDALVQRLQQGLKELEVCLPLNGLFKGYE